MATFRPRAEGEDLTTYLGAKNTAQSGTVDLGTPGPVNTSQPHPTLANPLPTVNSPGTTPPSATPIIPAGQVAANSTPPNAAALSQAQASGPAPQDSGQARIGVQNALNAPTFYKPDPASEQILNAKGEKLSYEQYKAQGGKGVMGQPNWTDVQPGDPPPPPNAPVIQQALDEDPGLQQLLANQKAFNDVIAQRKSLGDEYKSLIKEAGIEQLNTELLNAKNIIDGTEEDLRNEITKAGGFGTESQIQALTLARNKSLIKNYNNLLATKQMALENVNTMIGLASQDRDFALQSMTQKMNLDNEIIKYRDNMKTKATEQYKYLADKMGFDGLLAQTGGDPYYTKLIEKTLGLGAGGLQQLANQQAKERAMAQEKDKLGIELQKSQLDTEKFKLQQAKTEAPLDLALKKAQISATNASASASAASAAKSRAETAQLGKEEKAKQQIKNSVIKADVILNNVTKALGNVNKYTTGTFGGIASKVPGTPAYNLNSTVTTIKANIGFEELQAMRAASPTGGALGQVAVQELEALQATLGNLSVGQTPSQLTENLNAVKTHYTNWLSTVGYSVAPNGDIVPIK